jgi:hypothetical protein
MSQIDVSKILDGVVSQQTIESKINEYKVFYKTYLSGVRNRQAILSHLSQFAIDFQKNTPVVPLLDRERLILISNTESFLKQSLGDQILSLFKKQTPLPETRRNSQSESRTFLAELVIGLSQVFVTATEQNKQDWKYKTNFLMFLYNCLFHYGLHPDILSRNPDVFKRYNVILEHTFKSRGKMQKDCRMLLKQNTLQAEFLSPYEKKIPIRINGKLIPFASIYSIKITSTLLLDDEIVLLAAKSGFEWSDRSKHDLSFIHCCTDETEELHKNPYLIEGKERFKNQHTYFVDPARIIELKQTKNKNFDLAKLVKLCEELNSASSNKNFISSSLLVRAIIDHVPPVLGYISFSELANNYSGGTKSFKRSMLNLNNSLRNIADNNIHSLVRSKEVLPTQTQIDFSPELDLLLSEVVRVLK